MLKKSRERRTSMRRHRQLLSAAHYVISRRILDGGPSAAEPAEVAAIVFGRHGLRLSDTEALEYLNAALVDRGYPLRPANGEAGEQS